MSYKVSPVANPEGRHAQAWHLRESGLTWREVGEKLNITAHRAKQIADRYGRFLKNGI
tara:strand:+ start:5387 stop:5560 length:174 start_codon:yes stop_codon:yes gene_type:complete